jgi:hypothetical protein
MHLSTRATQRRRRPRTPPPRGGEPSQHADLVARFRQAIEDDTTAPHKRAELTRLLRTRDVDGRPVLSHAATHRATVDALMNAIFASTVLTFDDKRALMVRSLHAIGSEPCEADALLDAIVGALRHLHGPEPSLLCAGLAALLPFVQPHGSRSACTQFEVLLARRDIAACRAALVELLRCTGVDALTCFLRPKAGGALVHRLLAHEATAPLFLDLVRALPEAPGLDDWPRALEKLLFARTRHGRTPLWTAEIRAPGVVDTVMSLLHFILGRDDLCDVGKRWLLIGFAAPPPSADRVGWALIQHTYSQAFAAAAVDQLDDACLVELAVLRRFARWNERLTPDNSARLVDFVSRPDGNGRPLLWRACEEDKLDVVVDFVVDLMGKGEADISSADKFRVLAALLSPGTAHWPADPAPAVLAVIFDALSVRLDTPQAWLFSDELADLAMLMLPNSGAGRTVFAASLDAADRKHAPRIVRKLLQHRYIHVPRCLHRLDHQGQTLLHLAVEHDRDDVLGLLFAGLADHPLPPSHKRRVLHDLLFTKNREGFTALGHARRRGKAGMADRLLALLRESPILDAEQKPRWLRKMGGPR